MHALDLTIFWFLFKGAQNAWISWFAIFCAQYLMVILGVVFLIAVARQRNRKKQMYLLLFGIAGEVLARGIIAEVFYFVYHRARPFVELSVTALVQHAPTASFPSGHATFSFFLAFALFLYGKKWGWAGMVMAILIAWGRVAVGVHWPTDVLAGGLIAGLVFWGMIKWFPSENKGAESESVVS
ncbi:MAG: phosphatase PAP2 family protein [Candidatus Paceibacterota bacterium]|jgi:undecaprenyl-diphosphatase